MAVYVKQLLALDENTRTSTLQNLSHYAENKQEASSLVEDALRVPEVNMSVAMPETHEVWPEHPLRMTMRTSSKAEQPTTPPSCIHLEPATATFAADTPAKVTLPSSMSSGVPATSAQLQQAHGFLQAAMKNWEACVEQEASQQAQHVQQAQKNRAAAVMRPTKQAQHAQQALSSDMVNSLQRALSDLSTSLPPEAAVQAQQLLATAPMASAADAENLLQRGKNTETLKWMTQHLENQQAASMQKLSNMAMGPSGFAPCAWAPPVIQPAHALQGWGPAAMGSAMTGDFWWGEDASAYGALPGSPVQQRPARMRGALSHKGAAAVAVAHVPEGKKESLQTLRMHLQALLKVDCKRVLIARKINKLGFASDSVLHAHYSAYGEVERVLVAHSRVKASTTRNTQSAGAENSRLRPSGLAFVVMCNAESAQLILAQGSQQLVNGSVITVHQFERRMEGDEEEV